MENRCDLKPALRAAMQQQRNALQLAQRTRAAQAIQQRVLRSPHFVAARCVHCYLSMGSEVETRGILQHALDAGKRVCIPLWQRGSPETRALKITSPRDEDFVPGVFGLRVPRVQIDQPLEEIDLMLAPLLAFARGPQGIARLGYGAGYYDRLIAKLRAIGPRARMIGLAYSIQQMATIPQDPHDVPLDEVICES